MAVLADGTKEYSIKDHLGSVRVVASTNGQLRQYDYKPYGDTLQSGSYNNLRGYEGSERAPESRYMNLGARLYDPIIGRFLSVDPLWEAFPSWSPYQYAYNCPVSYKDPTGLAPQKEKGDRVMAVQLENASFEDRNQVNFMLQSIWQDDQARLKSDISSALYEMLKFGNMMGGCRFDFSYFIEFSAIDRQAWGNWDIDIGTPAANSGRVSLKGNSNINSKGLSAAEITFMETAINASPILQAMWNNIISSGVAVKLGKTQNQDSEVSDNGKDEIYFDIAEGIFGLDLTDVGNMAALLQHLGHEAAHIEGRITGERIKKSEFHINYSLYNLSGKKIPSEELRAQQIGNHIMREYLERVCDDNLNRPGFFNSWQLLHYSNRNNRFDMIGIEFPGSVDFSTYKKGAIIKQKGKKK